MPGEALQAHIIPSHSLNAINNANVLAGLLQSTSLLNVLFGVNTIQLTNEANLQSRNGLREDSSCARLADFQDIRFFSIHP